MGRKIKVLKCKTYKDYLREAKEKGDPEALRYWQLIHAKRPKEDKRLMINI